VKKGGVGGMFRLRIDRAEQTLVSLPPIYLILLFFVFLGVKGLLDLDLVYGCMYLVDVAGRLGGGERWGGCVRFVSLLAHIGSQAPGWKWSPSLWMLSCLLYCFLILAAELWLFWESFAGILKSTTIDWFGMDHVPGRSLM